MSVPVFTVGHSTHALEVFLDLLERNEITAIADVRSSPFSRFNPQYNGRDLKKSLAKAGIGYVFLGAELGARSDDPACYIDGKVQYNLLAESPAFLLGVMRVIEGSKKHRVALMCAEKEPLDCHRTILVSRELVERDVDVRHILPDGSCETHAAAMARLLDDLGISAHDMFKSREQIIEEAYQTQGNRIAYDLNSQSPRSAVDDADFGTTP